MLVKFVSVATLNISWMCFHVGYGEVWDWAYLQLWITVWGGEFCFPGYVALFRAMKLFPPEGAYA